MIIRPGGTDADLTWSLSHFLTS